MSNLPKYVVVWPDGRTDDWYSWVWFPGFYRGGIEKPLEETGLDVDEARRLIKQYNLPLRVVRKGSPTKTEVNNGK